MAHVFVSYSSRDAYLADFLVSRLEKAGIRCWIAPRDIPIGSHYADVIPPAIRTCTAFVLMLSEASQNSSWVKSEVEFARTYERKILPLLIEDAYLHEDFMFLLNGQIRPYYASPAGITKELIRTIQSMPPQVTVPKPVRQRPSTLGWHTNVPVDRWHLLETLRSEILNSLLDDFENYAGDEKAEFYQVFEEIKNASHEDLIDFTHEMLQEGLAEGSEDTEFFRKMLMDQVAYAAHDMDPAYAADAAQLQEDLKHASAGDLCGFFADLLNNA